MTKQIIYNLFSFDKGKIKDLQEILIDNQNNLDLEKMLPKPVPENLKYKMEKETLKTNLELDLIELMHRHGIYQKSDLKEKFLYQLYSMYFSCKSTYPGLLGEISSKASMEYIQTLLEKYINFDKTNFQPQRLKDLALNNIRKYGCLTEEDYYYKTFAIEKRKIPIEILNSKEFKLQTTHHLTYSFYSCLSKILQKTRKNCQITVHSCTQDPDGYLGCVFVGCKGVLEIYDHMIPTEDSYLEKCKMANKIKGLPNTNQYIINWHLENINPQSLKNQPENQIKVKLIEKYGKTIGNKIYKKLIQ